MEAYSAEHHRHSFSDSSPTSKLMRSPRNRAHRSVNLATIPRPPEEFVSASNVHGGLLRGGNFKNHSLLFPNKSSKQPPLLPLPAAIPKAQFSSFPPPNSGKQMPLRLARHSSLKPSKPLIRRQVSMLVSGRGSVCSGAGPLGPEPNELPKHVSISKVPNPSLPHAPPEPSSFLGSVFELAPPPSSLPLPKFSLRPKLGCNAEAGVDSGATDGLRRILRLRWPFIQVLCCAVLSLDATIASVLCCYWSSKLLLADLVFSSCMVKSVRWSPLVFFEEVHKTWVHA